MTTLYRENWWSRHGLWEFRCPNGLGTYCIHRHLGACPTMQIWSRLLFAVLALVFATRRLTKSSIKARTDRAAEAESMSHELGTER